MLAARLDGADAKTLRETLDKLKDKLKQRRHRAGRGGRRQVQLAAGVTRDAVGRVKAGDLVSHVARQVGGKRQQARHAMAGSSDARALPAALASVQGWVQLSACEALARRGLHRPDCGHGGHTRAGGCA